MGKLKFKIWKCEVLREEHTPGERFLFAYIMVSLFANPDRISRNMTENDER